MEELIHIVAYYVALALEASGLLAIVIGTVEALVGAFKLIRARRAVNSNHRAVWVDLTRWLSAALTFQLGADIVHTTISASWDDIGRVAAIAAIRTLLTYFLDREVAEGEIHHRLEQERPNA